MSAKRNEFDVRDLGIFEVSGRHYALLGDYFGGRAPLRGQFIICVDVFIPSSDLNNPIAPPSFIISFSRDI